MKASLTNVVREQFPGIAGTDIKDDLEIGSVPDWDSLAHFNLLLAVEQAYEIRFTVAEMSELKTIGQIRKAVTSRGVDCQ